MLEVDEDSRLGREILSMKAAQATTFSGHAGGGARYHADHVPADDLIADFYEFACDRLNAAGVFQYEISNFARLGAESRHNLKYWTRQPYLGFGVDAHSMIPPNLELLTAGVDALRFGMPDSLEEFLARPDDWRPFDDIISRTSALEETFFLGLRLNRGLRLNEVQAEFGADEVALLLPIVDELVGKNLLTRHTDSLENDVLRLTPRGRLLSNEVFEAFVLIGTEEDLPDLIQWCKDNPASEEPPMISKRIH